MAYVEPLDTEVEVDDPLVLRIPLNMGLLVAVMLCLVFWAAVIATVAELV
jgi:hypothetical protein